MYTSLNYNGIKLKNWIKYQTKSKYVLHGTNTSYNVFCILNNVQSVNARWSCLTPIQKRISNCDFNELWISHWFSLFHEGKPIIALSFFYRKNICKGKSKILERIENECENDCMWIVRIKIFLFFFLNFNVAKRRNFNRIF